MKWKILYEVRFRGLWEMTVEAETKDEAVLKLKDMVHDKNEIVRIQIA